MVIMYLCLVSYILILYVFMLYSWIFITYFYITLFLFIINMNGNAISIFDNVSTVWYIIKYWV